MVQTVLSGLVEKLLVPLLSSEQTSEKDARAVQREESADAVEFGCEDLQDNQCERELAQRRPNVGSLERALGSSNLNELGRCEYDRACSMKSKLISIRGMPSLEWL